MTNPGARETGTGNHMATAQTSSPAESLFKVVVNAEGQYSIWPSDRELPPGWLEAGHSGPKEGCLAFVDQVWTDMRPISLREAMAGTR